MHRYAIEQNAGHSDYKYAADSLLARLTDGSATAGGDARAEFFVDLSEGVTRALKKKSEGQDNFERYAALTKTQKEGKKAGGREASYFHPSQHFANTSVG